MKRAYSVSSQNLPSFPCFSLVKQLGQGRLNVKNISRAEHRRSVGPVPPEAISAQLEALLEAGHREGEAEEGIEARPMGSAHRQDSPEAPQGQIEVGYALRQAAESEEDGHFLCVDRGGLREERRRTF